MSNSVQQTRELVSGAITMIDKAVNNELSLDAQFCVGCLLSVKETLAKALAIHLRNCDVYATVSDARKAFNEWIKHNSPISFGGWLLSPAEESKCASSST